MHAANSGRGVATGLSLTLLDLNPLSPAGEVQEVIQLSSLSLLQ